MLIARDYRDFRAFKEKGLGLGKWSGFGGP